MARDHHADHSGSNKAPAPEWLRAMPTQERKVVALAAASRCAYLALVLLCSRLFDSYDTSAALVADTCGPDPALQRGPPRVPAISGLQVWDTVFYSRIASCGYEYEQYHAFLPLAPRLAGLLRDALLPGLHAQDGYVLAALLLNNLAFCATLLLFYRLSLHVLRSPALALTACVFYCCSPATVFHAMAYTEPLFGFFTTLGLYLLYCRGSLAGASLAFAASAGVRSNGVVSFGFVAHWSARRALAALRGPAPARWLALARCAAAAPLAGVVAAPYAAFQYWGYRRYCLQQAQPRPWCAAALPSLYGFVQSHYWGVGLFKYYQLQQVGGPAGHAHEALRRLGWGAGRAACSGCAGTHAAGWRGGRAPALGWALMPRGVTCVIPAAQPPLQLGNFLLAAPVLLLSAQGVAEYARADWRRFLTGGLLPEEPRQAPGGQRKGGQQRQRRGPQEAQQQEAQQQEAQQQEAQQQEQQQELGRGRGSAGYCGGEVAVFVFHWAFLAAVAAAVMHVQVATRFLSTCPPLYWYMAHAWQRGRARWLWAYCFAYMAAGAVLFPNFYPWT
jgi:Gpi18-like mannosyltransferase